ncbi:MAG: hypothetical protein IKM09_02255, partial [Clostridia bacterium]|nr:hypothetical protein [Clostridia bacterium]
AIVACPTQKTGEFKTSSYQDGEYYLVASNAFRNSKLDCVHFALGAVIDLPSSFRNTDVEIVVQQKVQNNVIR